MSVETYDRARIKAREAMCQLNAKHPDIDRMLTTKQQAALFDLVTDAIANAVTNWEHPVERPSVRNRYSPEEKAKIIREAGKHGVSATARKHRINTRLLFNWKRKAQNSNV